MPLIGAKILFLNGPNLNLLGMREPGLYGNKTLANVEDMMRNWASEHQCTLVAFQSNYEGQLVDKIQESLGRYDGIIINPGAFTHTSVAILDAVKAVNHQVPVVEIHISNVEERAKKEPFRGVSYLKDFGAIIGQVMGKGTDGYIEAGEVLMGYLEGSKKE